MKSYSSPENIQDEEFKDSFKPFLSISTLNTQLRDLIETEYRFVKVMGEISSINHHHSGHIYLTLKDDNALIQATIFKNLSKPHYQSFQVGDTINIWAGVSLYVKSGKYSLHIYHALKSGEGDLYQNFLATKQKLEELGLFNEDHKKPLPLLIKKLAIITAYKGAALEDFLSIFKNGQKIPMHIIVIPTLMQGSKALENLISSLEYAKTLPFLDAILLTRGGGAYEDLEPFNQELLAYHIYNYPIPTISAIGHEKDFTILDFVADHRFSTPSDAAHSLVKHQLDLLLHLQSLKETLNSTIQSYIQKNREHLIRYSPSYLTQSLSEYIKFKKKELNYLYGSLSQYMKSYLHTLRLKLHNLEQSLEQQNPLHLFKKGYQRVYNDKNEVLSDSKDLKKGQTLMIRFSDGVVSTTITDIKKN